MKDFILAALPWLLCGAALAIICAKLGGGHEDADKKLDQRIAVGMALGLLCGVLLDSLGLWENHALGLAAGPLWGMALAMLFQGGEHSGKG